MNTIDFTLFFDAFRFFIVKFCEVVSGMATEWIDTISGSQRSSAGAFLV